MGTRMLKDDHADLGSGKKGSVFPEETKTKMFKSAEGAGHMGDYPDREENIVATQNEGIKKAESHKPKAHFRY